MLTVSSIPNWADRLNAHCFCMSVDHNKLNAALEKQGGVNDIWPSLRTTHPHLFADNPAFVSAADMDAMAKAVAAIEKLSKLPKFKDLALATAPPIAHQDFGPRGILMGYDFHITPDGPKLIEINTNAGGAFLNAVLVSAMQACCDEVDRAFFDRHPNAFSDAILAMMNAEWSLQGFARPLHHVVIVDDDPHSQYLYPEFKLAQALLERAGFLVTIADPSELNWDGQSLTCRGTKIDFVYNRLVDFMLQEPDHEALCKAYESGTVVVSPNPHNHALLANKRILTLLSNVEFLAEIGADAEDIAALQVVPETLLLTAENAEDLWRDRKSYFFKPLDGHASKAVYRGDKITKRVWEDIQKHAYVAQKFVAPNQRITESSSGPKALKMDVRLYVYAGEVILQAARIYQGQTTNFRTPGGGFSPLFIV
jgi:hypothetical protein